MEQHICIYCGKPALYKMKNGSWCCAENARSCPAIKQKVALKAKLKWQLLKKMGIKYRKDIPIKKRDREDIALGICYYCGEEAVYKLSNGRWCCRQYTAQCPAIRKINSAKRKLQISKNKLYWCKRLIVPGRTAWNKGLTKLINNSLMLASKKMLEKWLSALYRETHKCKAHTKLTRLKLSAIRSTYIDSCKSGFKDVAWYTVSNIKGDVYTVRGKWLLNVALRLNTLSILWIRNKCIKYTQDDIQHTYNPDFYLPELDLYIEVKGYFSEKDKQKMNTVVTQHADMKIRFVLTTWYRKFVADKCALCDVPLYSVTI